MNEPIQLVTTKSDQDRATELKLELVAALDPALKILTKAQSEGFKINFGCSPNAFKQVVIQSISIYKEFD